MLNYPDSNRVDSGYMLALTETLANLTDDELAWVMHTRDGIATRCKYLPTAADIHAIIREKQAARDKFKPIPPRGPVFKDDGVDPRPDFERRKAQVMAALGYDPTAPVKVARRELTEPTAEEAARVFANLKTPPGPISAELRALLESEGYFG